MMQALEREHNEGEKRVKLHAPDKRQWWILMPDSNIANFFAHLYTLCALYNFFIFPVRLTFQVYEPYLKSSFLWYYDAVEVKKSLPCPNMFSLLYSFAVLYQ